MIAIDDDTYNRIRSISGGKVRGIGRPRTALRSDRHGRVSPGLVHITHPRYRAPPLPCTPVIVLTYGRTRCVVVRWFDSMSRCKSRRRNSIWLQHWRTGSGGVG